MRVLCGCVSVGCVVVVACSVTMCRVSSGRISKVGPRRAPVDVSTLEPVRRMAGDVMHAVAVAPRVDGEAAGRERGDVHRDEVKIDNVTIVSSLSLLRCWAHNARATYERMWRHHIGKGAEPFTFDVKTIEGEGTVLEREKKLHYFAEATVRDEERVWRMVQGSASAMSRWRKANRGGGKTRLRWKMRDEAVVAEIARREREGTLFSKYPAAVFVGGSRCSDFHDHGGSCDQCGWCRIQRYCA